MIKAKLDHCVIHVSNWARSNAFYAEVMGAEIIPRGGGFAYRFGTTQLNCHGPGVDAGDPGSRHGATLVPPAGERALSRLNNDRVPGRRPGHAGPGRRLRAANGSQLGRPTDKGSVMWDTVVPR